MFQPSNSPALLGSSIALMNMTRTDSLFKALVSWHWFGPVSIISWFLHPAAVSSSSTKAAMFEPVYNTDTHTSMRTMQYFSTSTHQTAEFHLCMLDFSLGHWQSQGVKFNTVLMRCYFSSLSEEKQRSLCASLPPSISIASVIKECRLPSVVAKIAVSVLCCVPATGIWQENEQKSFIHFRLKLVALKSPYNSTRWRKWLTPILVLQNKK